MQGIGTVPGGAAGDGPGADGMTVFTIVLLIVVLGIVLAVVLRARPPGAQHDDGAYHVSDRDGDDAG